MASILIVDDEEKMRKILAMTLQEEGHEVLQASQAGEAIGLIKSTSLSLIITDLRMPGGGGMAVLESVNALHLSIPVIILTAYGTIENAVEALKKGAFDYLLKPCDLDEIRLAVRRALQMQHLERENLYLRNELDLQVGQHELIGKSDKMTKLFALIRRVAQGDGTVLIRGENGTGREMVARAIHRQSSRGEKPFITANCSATPPDILEQELFGRMRNVNPLSEPDTGKFELAHGGTLFLDDIGFLTLRLQGKILRTIEEKLIEPVGDTRSKKIDVRIIASTHQDLEELVRTESFRADLFYRLNVLPISVPPLRERKEDIPLLIRHFLQQKSRGDSHLAFTSAELDTLKQYHWPGNVRELQNMIERAIVLNTTDLRELLPSLPSSLPAEEYGAFQHPELLNLSYKEAKKNLLDSFEKSFFSNLLHKTGGNVSRAAQMAQVHRKNFYVKLSELHLDPKQFAQSDTPETHE